MSKTTIETRDLPLEEARNLAALMLRLHGDFRRRHGLPPLPTAWTLLDDMEALRSRASAAGCLLPPTANLQARDSVEFVAVLIDSRR